MRANTMAWLKTPLHDPHPFWEPEWGLHLLRDKDDHRDKSTPIFGASDEFIAEHLCDKLLHACFGKNRKVFAICNNGTTAVTLALANAAPPGQIRLVGIGSYAGAFWATMTLSSVPCDINDFYKRPRNALEYIVPLPYVTQNELDDPKTHEFEDLCLHSIQVWIITCDVESLFISSISCIRFCKKISD